MCAQAVLQHVLDRCPRLVSLEMPAAEQPSAQPLSAPEQRSAHLVAQRLSRPAGAWTLQQLPATLSELCLTECGWVTPVLAPRGWGSRFATGGRDWDLGKVVRGPRSS
jgi:hypothetical protein